MEHPLTKSLQLILLLAYPWQTLSVCVLL
ncbi:MULTISPECIES: hypothetical protein [Vibrio]